MARRATQRATLPNAMSPSVCPISRGASDSSGRPLNQSPERDHLIHLFRAPAGRQQQHHGVIGDFLDEDVGHVGDDDAGRGGRVDVDHVDADAADADHHAAFEAGDDLAVDLDAPRRDQRVCILRAGKKLCGGRARHFDEIGNAIERLEFKRIAFRDVAGLRDRRQLNGDFFLARHADAFRPAACKAGDRLFAQPALVDFAGRDSRELFVAHPDVFRHLKAREMGSDVRAHVVGRQRMFGLTITTAAIDSPRRSSGTPNTAHSDTHG